MCTYTGHHFGARYEDACCIDGYLWDLDSGDDGMLSSGGDIPCPACNLERYVANIDEEALDTAYNDDEQPAHVLARWLLTGTLRRLHGLEAFRAALKAGAMHPLWFPDSWPADPETPPIGRVAWPWPLPDEVAATLSAHERLTLATMAEPRDPAFLPNPDGLYVRPLEPDDWT